MVKIVCLLFPLQSLKSEQMSEVGGSMMFFTTIKLYFNGYIKPGLTELDGQIYRTPLLVFDDKNNDGKSGADSPTKPIH